LITRAIEEADMSVVILKPAADTAPIAGPKPIALLVDAAGASPMTSAGLTCAPPAATAVSWLDVFGGDDAERKTLFGQLGLEETDVAWLQRAPRPGRMVIARQRLRVLTWLADPAGNVIEVHMLCHGQRILTVWRGDAAILDDIRQHFAERIGAIGKSPFQAAAMLLQLLLATLDHAIRALDAQLDQLRVQLDDGMSGTDFARLAAQRQELQAAWLGFDRYGSAVRSAMVGVEAVPGMDPRGAEELNDYADQVEDFEQQLRERRRWLSDILHDAATAIAQSQGEQINRLTLVSLIFLPVTAVTGFFGMNFNWMIGALNGATPFFSLGVLLPTSMVLLTVGWLCYRGFIRFGRRRPSASPADKS
jgi:Mg2+ and Co2+ transporter CorA